MYQKGCFVMWEKNIPSFKIHYVPHSYGGIDINFLTILNICCNQVFKFYFHLYHLISWDKLYPMYNCMASFLDLCIFIILFDIFFFAFCHTVWQCSCVCPPKHGYYFFQQAFFHKLFKSMMIKKVHLIFSILSITFS